MSKPQNWSGSKSKDVEQIINFSDIEYYYFVYVLPITIVLIIVLILGHYLKWW